MNRLLLLTLLTCLTLPALAQSPIPVADLEIRVGRFSSEEVFFAFAQGDEIVLDVREKKGRKMAEVSIEQYPNATRYNVRGQQKIEQATLKVSETNSPCRFGAVWQLKYGPCRFVLLPSNQTHTAHANTSGALYDLRQHAGH